MAAPTPTVPPIPRASVQQPTAAPGSAQTERLNLDRINTCTRRLRTAISAISESSPTFARTTLGRYLMFVGSGRMDLSDLPVTVRPHPLNPERHQNRTDKWTLLFFHCGNAIRALRASCKTTVHPALEKRVALLEKIAKLGVEAFYPSGKDIVEKGDKNEDAGWTLALIPHKAERPAGEIEVVVPEDISGLINDVD